MLADNAESDLPTLVNLAPGEALDAYLERVADANYLTTARLIEMVRAGHGSTTAYLMLAPTPATLKRIAHLTGAAAAALQNATLAAYDGTSLDLHGLDPAHQSSFRTIAARGWIPGHGTQICPQCLADDGIWRITWRKLPFSSPTRFEAGTSTPSKRTSQKWPSPVASTMGRTSMPGERMSTTSSERPACGRAVGSVRAIR